MTGLTFSMLDGRKEKTNKQIDKQTNKIQLDNFRRILCPKQTPWFGTEMSNTCIMKENDG